MAVEYTGETLTITPSPLMRAAVLAAAGITDELAHVPEASVAYVNLTDDYTQVRCTTCGWRSHAVPSTGGYARVVATDHLNRHGSY